MCLEGAVGTLTCESNIVRSWQQSLAGNYRYKSWQLQFWHNFFMSCLPKNAPQRQLYIHVPLLQNVLLFYSDCCADTYYPDHFGALLTLFNHITPRVVL
jgi:hypothetical protein